MPIRVTYNIGDSFISVHYQNENLKLAVHQVIAHLKSDVRNDTTEIMRITESENTFNYCYNDFIAAYVDGNVYPFPAAVSVKSGAVKALSEYYPELKQKISQKAHTGKSVKYLPIDNANEIKSAPFNVKAVVFVNYNLSGPFIFKEAGKREA